MKLFLKAVVTCEFFILLSPVISAQSGPASVDIALQMKTGRAYKTGSPYCATKEYGTAKGQVCRDSLGRGRIELADHLVEIYDPVEQVAHTLDAAHRRASRTVIPQPAPPDSSASLPPTANFAAGKPSPAVESLGTEVIEGLVVEGTRRPTGLELLANGEEEIWFSQELGEVIVMKRSDGLNGSIVVYRLTHIDRSEPDPSMFRVPANCAISDSPDFGDMPSFVDSR